MKTWKRVVPKNVVVWDEQRMMEVIQRFANGEESRDIAKIYGIQIDTLRKHLMRWYQQTGTDNRCHLVAWGFRTGRVT